MGRGSTNRSGEGVKFSFTPTKGYEMGGGAKKLLKVGWGGGGRRGGTQIVLG